MRLGEMDTMESMFQLVCRRIKAGFQIDVTLIWLVESSNQSTSFLKPFKGLGKDHVKDIQYHVKEETEKKKAVLTEVVTKSSIIVSPTEQLKDWNL